MSDDTLQIPEGLKRIDASQPPRKLRADEGAFFDLESVGTRMMVWSEESGGGFSLNEHPIKPKMLVAPLHRHENEDEYCYVLEGRLGVMLGDDVHYVEQGELSFRPKKQWHTFWNPEDTPCRVLEFISPGGFEHFFREWADGLRNGNLDVPELSARYQCESDWSTVKVICDKYGLLHPGYNI